MKNSPLTAPEIRRFINNKDDLDLARIHYCYQLGSTFVSLSLMEDSIISAMSICDRIKVASLLGEDAPAWEKLKVKSIKLKSSTLGNLINILSKHEILDQDISYLRWVKDKRDFFIHRFFHDHHWPGDLDEQTSAIMCRRLRYLDAIFYRASCRIWKIFGNAGLLIYTDLGKDGALMMNPDLFGDDEE